MNIVHAAALGFLVIAETTIAGIIWPIVSHTLVVTTSHLHSLIASRIHFHCSAHSSAVFLASLYSGIIDNHWSRSSSLLNAASRVLFLCSFICVHISPSCTALGNQTTGDVEYFCIHHCALLIQNLNKSICHTSNKLITLLHTSDSVTAFQNLSVIFCGTSYNHLLIAHVIHVVFVSQSSKSGVCAFFNVVSGLLHNKSLALTVGVVVVPAHTVACDTGVKSSLGVVIIDCADLAVCVTFGVSVTLGVSVLHAFVAVEEAAICFCFSFTSCCIFDCMLDFRFATCAIYILCSI